MFTDFPCHGQFALSFPSKIAHDILEYEDRLKVESKVQEKIVFFEWPVLPNTTYCTNRSVLWI